MASLVERKHELQSENTELRSELSDKELKLRALELRVLELGQRREDALKQLDELIARVEGFEAQFGEARR